MLAAGNRPVLPPGTRQRWADGKDPAKPHRATVWSTGRRVWARSPAPEAREAHTGHPRRRHGKPKKAAGFVTAPETREIKKGGAFDPAGASCHGRASQGQGDRTAEGSQRPHLGEGCGGGLCEASGSGADQPSFRPPRDERAISVPMVAAIAHHGPDSRQAAARFHDSPKNCRLQRRSDPRSSDLSRCSGSASRFETGDGPLATRVRSCGGALHFAAVRSATGSAGDMIRRHGSALVALYDSTLAPGPVLDLTLLPGGLH